MNRFTDIMLDLETFGTSNNAAIVSIGAVAFKADGENATLYTNSPDALVKGGQGFRANINLGDTARELRGEMDPGAIEFWLKQSAEAREMLVAGPRVRLGVALQEFASWVNLVGTGRHDVRLWSNGPTFDETIIRAAFDRYKLDLPISFRGSRCCRTMIEMAELHGYNRREAAQAAFGGSELVAHDALSDAVFQARGVISQRLFLRLGDPLAQRIAEEGD